MTTQSYTPASYLNEVKEVYGDTVANSVLEILSTPPKSTVMSTTYGLPVSDLLFGGNDACFDAKYLESYGELDVTVFNCGENTKIGSKLNVNCHPLLGIEYATIPYIQKDIGVIVGCCSKGPIMTPTKVLTVDEFKDVFGEPDPTIQTMVDYAIDYLEMEILSELIVIRVNEGDDLFPSQNTLINGWNLVKTDMEFDPTIMYLLIGVGCYYPGVQKFILDIAEHKDNCYASLGVL